MKKKKTKMIIKRFLSVALAATVAFSGIGYLPHNYTYSKAAEEVPEKQKGSFTFSDGTNNYKAECAYYGGFYITKLEQIVPEGTAQKDCVLPKKVVVPSTVTLNSGETVTVTDIGGGTEDTPFLGRAAIGSGNLDLIDARTDEYETIPLILPNTINTIESYAFSDNMWYKIKSININNIKSIEKNAFYNCEANWDIIIPETCKEIEENAFTGARETKLYVLNPNVQFKDTTNTFSCKSYIGYKHSTLADLVGSDLVSFDDYSGDLPDKFSKPTDTSFKVNVSLENSEVTSNGVTITPKFDITGDLYSYIYLTDNVLSAKNIKMNLNRAFFDWTNIGLYNKAGTQLFNADGDLLTSNKSDFDFSDDDNSEATVYAKFKLSKYDIDYYNCEHTNENGENEMVVSGLNYTEIVSTVWGNVYRLKYTYGDKFVLPTENENFHRIGYTFDGWYDEDEQYSFGKKVTEIDTLSKTGFILYAHWKVNAYNISFDYNGGKRVSDTDNTIIKHTYGDNTVSLNDAVRDNYTFTGWKDTNTGKIVTEVPKYQAKDVIYKAQWKANTPAVTPTSAATTTPTVKPSTSPTVKPADDNGGNSVPIVSSTPEPTATSTPSIQPTIKPTETPSNGGSSNSGNGNSTIEPTVAPTQKPTAQPTKTPVSDDMNGDIVTKPTAEPTKTPASDDMNGEVITTPTIEPTTVPTAEPTVKPTETPTVEPTIKPVKYSKNSVLAKKKTTVHGITVVRNSVSKDKKSAKITLSWKKYKKAKRYVIYKKVGKKWRKLKVIKKNKYSLKIRKTEKYRVNIQKVIKNKKKVYYKNIKLRSRTVKFK